jgi:hypothetical protein
MGKMATSDEEKAEILAHRIVYFLAFLVLAGVGMHFFFRFLWVT